VASVRRAMAEGVPSINDVARGATKQPQDGGGVEVVDLAVPNVAPALAVADGKDQKEHTMAQPPTMFPTESKQGTQPTHPRT